MKLKTLLILFILFKLTVGSSQTSEVPASSLWERSWSHHLWFKTALNKSQNPALTSIDSDWPLANQSTGLLFQENFKARKNNIQWIFRPSVEIKMESFSKHPELGTQSKTQFDARINELFVQKDLNSDWIVAFGLQNYQWGPAEFLSPSNPLFHLSLEAQDSTFQARGHSLLRLNYSPNGDWSFVSLFEIAHNEEGEFIAEQPFTPMGLVKAEYRLFTPLDYLGLSFGNEQMHDPFVGIYGNMTIEDGISFYWDLKQTSISHRYYPHVDFGQIPRMNLYNFHGSIYMLALIGLRFEFENFDLRWEEISNELGLSEDEMSAAMASQQTSRILHNGRELPSKNYSYISLRMPRWMTWLDSSLAFRYLRAHQDRTSQWTLQWDGTWGDHWSTFFNGQGTLGKQNGEFTFLYKNKINLGLKYAW